MTARVRGWTMIIASGPWQAVGVCLDVDQHLLLRHCQLQTAYKPGLVLLVHQDHQRYKARLAWPRLAFGKSVFCKSAKRVTLSDMDDRQMFIAINSQPLGVPYSPSWCRSDNRYCIATYSSAVAL